MCGPWLWPRERGLLQWICPFTAVTAAISQSAGDLLAFRLERVQIPTGVHANGQDSTVAQAGPRGQVHDLAVREDDDATLRAREEPPLEVVEAFLHLWHGALVVASVLRPSQRQGVVLHQQVHALILADQLLALVVIPVVAEPRGHIGVALTNNRGEDPARPGRGHVVEGQQGSLQRAHHGARHDQLNAMTGVSAQRIRKQLLVPQLRGLLLAALREGRVPHVFVNVVVSQVVHGLSVPNEVDYLLAGRQLLARAILDIPHDGAALKR
mmetsp:Transcript_95513/g.221556  ORF Transcript_95513/g.221556 Transcript_95513/m.221556 type:complete len:268 (-) Transcript_95513:129-932(-)